MANRFAFPFPLLTESSDSSSYSFSASEQSRQRWRSVEEDIRLNKKQKIFDFHEEDIFDARSQHRMFNVTYRFQRTIKK